MTPDQLEADLDAAFARGLQDLAEGEKATLADGKPAFTMKEQTEYLKAATDYWLAKRGPTGQNAPKWGEALVKNGGVHG